MRHKIVKVTYKNKDGTIFNGYFIRAVNGLVPITIDPMVTAYIHNKLIEIDSGDIEIELWKSQRNAQFADLQNLNNIREKKCGPAKNVITL